MPQNGEENKETNAGYIVFMQENAEKEGRAVRIIYILYSMGNLHK